MHCWFCESVAAVGPSGLYCPFRCCPVGKVDPGPLHDTPSERWVRLREAGRLNAVLADAGLPPPNC